MSSLVPYAPGILVLGGLAAFLMVHFPGQGNCLVLAFWGLVWLVLLGAIHRTLGGTWDNPLGPAGLSFAGLGLGLVRPYRWSL